jgi:hypothetical protein
LNHFFWVDAKKKETPVTGRRIITGNVSNFSSNIIPYFLIVVILIVIIIIIIIVDSNMASKALTVLDRGFKPRTELQCYVCGYPV